MRKFFYIIILLLFVSCAIKQVEGLYITKFDEIDNIKFYINLNCDGTALTINIHNKEQDTTKAKWFRNKDTLFITFDSVRYQNHPSQKLMYKIKRNKLIYVAFSKESFKLEIQKMKARGLSDTLKLKKYKMFKSVVAYNKYINRIPVNVKNKFRNQVFVKQIDFECMENTLRPLQLEK